MGYVLGPTDQLIVRGLNGERINETVTIAEDGTVTVPLLGRVDAAGRSADDLERKLNEQFKAFIREPNVSVSLAVPQSRRISVIGAVSQPGVHVIRGCTTVVEAISQAGGLRQDAGNIVNITRPKRTGLGSPVNGSDTGMQYEIFSIRLSDLLEARRPEANIFVKPEDVISIPRAHLVYVMGDVQRAGGFVLTERDNMSVLEALSLAGGLGPTPAPGGAHILRNSGTANRSEIPVDLKKIINGKISDVLLQPDDILFVPSSTMQKVTLRTVEAVIQAGTGFAIWR